MNNLYTVGFTQKTAERFFSLLIQNGIDLLLDIRLNNTSQLAGFSKYPDIEFFLSKICNIEYKHDILLSPTENTLSRYKKKIITWEIYVEEFNSTMNSRNINEYIKKTYKNNDNICLLCSEPTAEFCHRRLIAERFKRVFNGLNIIKLKGGFL